VKTETANNRPINGNLTLGELLEGAPLVIQELAERASAGPIWTPRPSDGSFAPALLRAAVLSYLNQAMGAYSVLRYWTEANEYARGLTVWQILSTFTLGSLESFMLTEHIANAQEILEQWAYQADEREQSAQIDIFE
jgi:hypothetical protein